MEGHVVIEDALTKALQLDFVAFLGASVLQTELAMFIQAYLAHRRADGSAPLIDRLVVTVVHRLVCASQADQQRAIGHFRSASYADLLSSSVLLRLSALIDVCSLLGDANSPVAKQIASAALALSESSSSTSSSSSSSSSSRSSSSSGCGLLLKDLSDLFHHLDASCDELRSACRAISSPPEPSSVNKSAQAKVVSLGRKPSLAEQAKATALAAAAATIPASLTPKLGVSGSGSPEDLARLHALAKQVCEMSHSLACLLSALPPETLNSPALDVFMVQRGAQGQQAEGFVGQAGERLLLALRRIYEQIVPAVAAAKTAVVKGLNGAAGSATAAKLTAEIDGALALASSRLVKALHAVFMAAQAGILKSDGRFHANADASTCTNWPVILEKLVSPPPASGAAAEDEWLVGALLADTFKSLPQDLPRCVRAMCTDAEQAGYFLDVLGQHHTAGLFAHTLKPHVNSTSSTSLQSHTPSSAAGNGPDSPRSQAQAGSQQQSQQQMKEAVEAVMSIFSDVGEGFAAACLQAFDWQADRTIDALLNDNLPPHIRKLERNLKAAWIGKGGPAGGREVGAVGASAAKVYVLPENEAFKRAQKERLIAEERRREEDHALMAAEYQDDYDDQWDDATEPVESLPLSSGGGRDKKASSKAGNQSLAQKIQWEVQMDKMKRVNQLIREKEAEDRYWQDMRNLNHERPVQSSLSSALGSATGDEVGCDRAATSSKPGAGAGAGPGQSRSSGGGNPAGGKSLGSKSAAEKDKAAGKAPPPGQTDGGAKGKGGQGQGQGQGQKPRTKTFDKHHAKDKTLKGRAFL